MSPDPEIVPCAAARPAPRLFKPGELPDDAYFNAPYGLFAPEDQGDGGAQADPGRSGRSRKRSSSRRASTCGSARKPTGVRASFLPGRGRKRARAAKSLDAERMSLAGDGAVLEKGIVYIAPLDRTAGAAARDLSGAANPKSSTGRLDIFTRLIVDGSEAFDDAPLGYHGPLWLEISPRSFSVRVREGSRLNQIRFRSRNSQQLDASRLRAGRHEIRERHAEPPLVDGELDLRDGLIMRVGAERPPRPDRRLSRAEERRHHRRRQRPAPIAAERFLGADPRAPDRPADPRPRRILYPRLAREDADSRRTRRRDGADRSGDRRVPRPLRRLLRSRLRPGPDGRPGARAVLEVRSRDVPFLLEDGQPVGRLVYERSPSAGPTSSTAPATSNYQGQGLKLSKHFRAFGAVTKRARRGLSAALCGGL